MENNKITPEEVKKNMHLIDDTSLPQDVLDEWNKAVEQAEKEIEEKQLCNCVNCQEKRLRQGKTANVHLRVAYSELERCKKVAEKKGLKYQTYIKSVLKQALDRDEQSA
jgi:predicted DNA binding CopG/RHH family protein